MRIISGIAGGLPLDVPKTVTRPTQDRVRQAIFSMLADRIEDARVLDLFAGSGAVGLECLSRGAASALMVDQDRGAAEIIKKNLVKTRLEGGQIRQTDVFRQLAALAKEGALFDLIFADPPYTHKASDTDFSAKLAACTDLMTVLAPGGAFVLECMVTKGGSVSWAPWIIERDREYGSTRILWLSKPDVQPQGQETSETDV